MESIWSQTCELTKRPALSKDIEVDVAVIGGGMAGILTAWQLERAGVRTVVLEADKIGGGQDKEHNSKDHIPAWDVLSYISCKKGRRDRQKICTGEPAGGGGIQKNHTGNKNRL